MIVYHGSPNQNIVPTFGLGEEKHDYGKGFYLIENIELAKEWAVCTPTEVSGWVHKYELDLNELKVLDFEKESILSWLAELMMLGGLRVQYCIKTEKAYSKLVEVKEEMITVNYQEFNQKYNERDINARENMRLLINSDKNKVTKVFSTLI